MTSEERELGARIFAALASPGRLRIVERLAQGSASVKEITEAAGLKQSITSQHLAALLHAGIVICTPCGTQHIYRLRGPRIVRILALVEDFYEGHLQSLRAVLARHEDVVSTSAPGNRAENQAEKPHYLSSTGGGGPVSSQPTAGIVKAT